MSRVRAIGGGGLAFFQRVISGLNSHFFGAGFLGIVGGGGEAVGQKSARRGAVVPRI